MLSTLIRIRVKKQTKAIAPKYICLLFQIAKDEKNICYFRKKLSIMKYFLAKHTFSP